MFCKNCHKETKKLDKRKLCKSCASAFYPDEKFIAVYEDEEEEE